MSDDRIPWAHVAIQDGYWCGVISDRLDVPKLEKSWRKEVAKFCGDHIADGGQIITVYSREEYDQTMKDYPMIPSDWKKREQSSTATPQMSLFP